MKLVYIVSGFPRSGTTAMMQALEAGNLEVVKNKARADRLARASKSIGDDYDSHADYEVTHAERQVSGWPYEQHAGKAVKIVAPWLKVMDVGLYKIAFMRRNTEEIRQSLEAARFGKVTNEFIDNTVQRALRTLKNRRDVLEITEIWYDDLLSDPEKELSRLNWPINIKEAASVIDSDKKRFRLENLIEGA